MEEERKYACLTVRFPAKLYDAIKSLARTEQRSINSQIVYMIQNGTIEYGVFGLGADGAHLETILRTREITRQASPYSTYTSTTMAITGDE